MLSLQSDIRLFLDRKKVDHPDFAQSRLTNGRRRASSPTGNSKEKKMEQIVNGNQMASPAFSGKPEDFQRDLALLAKEQAGQPLEPTQTEPPKETPAQPEQPQATATPPQEPQIPEKFKNADGSVSVERIEKSTVNAQEAYEKYRQKEIELQRKMNEVNRLSQMPAIPQPQTYAPPQPRSLAEQINAELAANPQNPGQVLEKLFDAARMAGYSQAAQEVNMVRQEVELSKRQIELERIAKDDPWVLSDEGFTELMRIRENKPWLNASPAPMTSAYREYLADSVLKQRSGQQVRMPTPKAQAAPVAPAQAVDRTQPQPAVSLANADKQSLDNLFKNKSPQEEAAIFKSLGFNVERWQTK